jgi:type I restriction enzyme S subunit
MDFRPGDAEKYRLAPGDVLVCEGGEVGRAAVWNGQLSECYFQKALHRVHTSEALSPAFLRYLLDHYARTNAFAQFTSGSTIAHLPQEDLRDLPVNLPPRSEQERIVAAIEEHLSRVDAGEAALQRIRRNLDRMRSAVLDVAMQLAEDEGAVPVALGDLLEEGRKIAYGVLVPGDDVPGGVPLIRVGDLKDRGVRAGSLKRIAPSVAKKFPRTLLRGGEVLLTVVGTIGRTAVVPMRLAGANTARAVSVIPVRSDVNPEYVAMVLSRSGDTTALTKLAHEVARKTLNLEDVRRYTIPLPAIDVQIKIVNFVETKETWIADVERAVVGAARRSAHLRSALLAAAFSGELVPQDNLDRTAAGFPERVAAQVFANRHESSLGAGLDTRITI